MFTTSMDSLSELFELGELGEMPLTASGVRKREKALTIDGTSDVATPTCETSGFLDLPL